MQEYTEKHVTVIKVKDVLSLVTILGIGACCSLLSGCFNGRQAVCRVCANECSFSMGH